MRIGPTLRLRNKKDLPRRKPKKISPWKINKLTN